MEQDLEKLEDVEVTFGKGAFSPKKMYCNGCDLPMERANIEMTITPDIKVKLNIFRCLKCKEESMGLDEAKKLDKALIMGRLLSNGKNQFSFKRKVSFDGDNFIFRLPSEMTKGKKPKEISVIPLELNEALIRW